MAEAAEDSTNTAQSSKTIFIQGLTSDKDLDEELLGLYFENRKHGGGDIKKIILDDEAGAQIIFHQSEGKRVFI